MTKQECYQANVSLIFVTQYLEDAKICIAEISVDNLRSADYLIPAVKKTIKELNSLLRRLEKHDLPKWR